MAWQRCLVGVSVLLVAGIALAKVDQVSSDCSACDENMASMVCLDEQGCHLPSRLSLQAPQC